MFGWEITRVWMEYVISADLKRVLIQTGIVTAGLIALAAVRARYDKRGER